MFKKSICIILATLVFAMTGCSQTAETDSSCGAYTADATVIQRGNQLDVYHLGNKATCGITEWRNDIIDFEGLAGLRVTTSGTKVTYTAYSHNKTYAVGGNVVLRRDRKDTGISLGCVKADESNSFDIAQILDANKVSSPNGLFELAMKLPDQDVCTHLWFDGQNVQTCRIGSNMSQKIKVWNDLTGKIDPETCLGMYVGNPDNPITYPTSGQNGNCNHVRQWRELSHEIIINDKWTDEAKVYAIVQWLARNCAYDDWRVSVNNNKSRATLAQTWDDDSLWMFYNHCGNCWSFANACTIMLREQDIPCTSVDNGFHTANAVWLNGEWVCIDVSVLVAHHCCEEDTAPDKWIDVRHGTYRDDYGYYETMFNTYNQGLCTPITATSTTAQNPM